MQTSTRAQILKLIEKNGKIRPHELHQALRISPQAVHRHLKKLVEQGIVEVKGKMPLTHYVLAGVSDWEGVAKWLSARALMKNPPDVCETRDTLAARLPQFKSFLKNGLPPDLLPIVISTAGEIGNNSFDHNSGQWRDVSGCWFESQATGRELWICIADRGQGVFQSLAKVHPHLADDQAALTAAFETIISGRAPEKRGNGLKFVRENISSTPGGGIACLSGTGKVFYGEQGRKCLAQLEKNFIKVNGTITLMIWRLR